MNKRPVVPVLVGLVALVAPALAPTLAVAQGPTVEERVAALRQSLTESQQALSHYEWIETTRVSLKGEQKAELQKRCYHGADGQLQKVQVGEPPPQKKKRGLRGRVAAKKKGELTEYMEQAVDLVHHYVPPDPERIRQAKDTGKASLHVLEPGKRVRLDFADYHKPGDTLGVEMSLTDNRLLGLSVNTYLESPKDSVGLSVRFSTLMDGSSYPSQVDLDAPAKEMGVVVQNSGYKKIR